jgi:hypothetical protein
MHDLEADLCIERSQEAEWKQLKVQELEDLDQTRLEAWRLDQEAYDAYLEQLSLGAE